jgi:hypothetical protein
MYNKIRSKLGRGLDLPTIGKNLFVELAERIAKELNVSICWVCGGALMRGMALERDQSKCLPTFIM